MSVLSVRYVLPVGISGQEMRPPNIFSPRLARALEIASLLFSMLLPLVVVVAWSGGPTTPMLGAPITTPVRTRVPFAVFTPAYPTTKRYDGLFNS